MRHTCNRCRSLHGHRFPRDFCGCSSANVQQTHVLGVRRVNGGCCEAAHAGGAAAARGGACFSPLRRLASHPIAITPPPTAHTVQVYGDIKLKCGSDYQASRCVPPLVPRARRCRRPKARRRRRRLPIEDYSHKHDDVPRALCARCPRPPLLNRCQKVRGDGLFAAAAAGTV